MARETTVTTEWNGKELMIEAMKKMETNAERVGMMLDGAVVRSLSSQLDQPPHRDEARICDCIHWSKHKVCAGT